jgi:hypothetical protein
MLDRDNWKVLQALKTFKMNGETIRRGDYFGAIASFAKEYVREGRARILSAAELKDPKPPAPSNPRGPWRDTVRPGDTFWWQISMKLPHLAKPYIRAKHNEQSRQAVRRASPTYLDEIGGYNKRASPAQREAIEYLERHEAKLYQQLVRAIATYANELRRNWSTGRKRPRRLGTNEITEHITFKSIALSNRSREGTAYLEVSGECSWDREHGFKAVVHRDRVVGVMQQGTGWSDRRRK